jgi:nicotinamide riboside kinase
MESADRMKISILGAESTGKTTLALALADHFVAQGRDARVVREVLREWCASEGRTPRPEEQMPIAQEQERRVDTLAREAQVVIGDTSALMVAIYSAMLFEDGSLYRFAIERQRQYDFTLVTGLDLPWVADGLQRDGPHVRGPVDALVREALDKARIPYRVIYGEGEERLENTLVALGEMQRAMPARKWQWTCEKCSDPDCEHRLFTGIIRG